MFKWVILLVLLISGGVLTYLYKELGQLEKTPITATSTTPITRDALPLLHSYKNGIHRYIGTIKLPNSCHEVSAIILRDEKILDVFEMRITTNDLQMQTPFCSQLTSRYQFSVDEEGPEVVKLRVKLNGKEKEFRITESTTATTDLIQR